MNLLNLYRYYLLKFSQKPNKLVIHTCVEFLSEFSAPLQINLVDYTYHRINGELIIYKFYA